MHQSRRPSRLLSDCPVNQLADDVEVNDNRTQLDSLHRHRVLCNRTEIPVSPYGISRGAVVTFPFTDVDTTPQPGHPAAEPSAAVSTCTTRAPNWICSTC